jgi:hypothetical protein
LLCLGRTPGACPAGPRRAQGAQSSTDHVFGKYYNYGSSAMGDPPSAFDPDAFREEVVAQCATEHTRVYASAYHDGFCVATTGDGRVLVWGLGQHLVRLGTPVVAAPPSVTVFVTPSRGVVRLLRTPTRSCMFRCYLPLKVGAVIEGPLPACQLLLLSPFRCSPCRQVEVWCGLPRRPPPRTCGLKPTWAPCFAQHSCQVLTALRCS